MTKKDYEKFAEMIRVDKHTFDGKAFFALIVIQDQIADIFEQDSPKFDRERFYEACKPTL